MSRTHIQTVSSDISSTEAWSRLTVLLWVINKTFSDCPACNNKLSFPKIFVSAKFSTSYMSNALGSTWSSKSSSIKQIGFLKGISWGYKYAPIVLFSWRSLICILIGGISLISGTAALRMFPKFGISFPCCLWGCRFSDWGRAYSVNL